MRPTRRPFDARSDTRYPPCITEANKETETMGKTVQQAYQELVSVIVADATDDVTGSMSTILARGKQMESLVVHLGEERARRAEAAAARIAARTPRLCSGAPNPAFNRSRHRPAA